MPEDRVASTSSLERGLQLLTHVAEVGSTTVAAAAAALQLPGSTTYRYFRALRKQGFLQEQSPGRYQLGTAAMTLAGRYVTQSQLSELGPPVLQQVLEVVGESVVLNVRVGSHAMCLCRVEPDKALKYTFAINELLPLHAGAPQRILLAWAPPGVLREVLDRPLPAYTDSTLSKEDLIQSLAEIRKNGFTISRGELDAGAISVAVPVVVQGEAVCALNTAGAASSRDTQTWIRLATRALHAAARDLGDELEALTPRAPTRGQPLRG